MISDSSRVRELYADDLPSVVTVLCDAFGGYPVMRHVLRGNTDDYSRDLERLIHFFVQARVLRGEPVLGAGQGDALSGVALVSDPGNRSSPEQLAEVREALWSELGDVARKRYEEYGDAAAGVLVDRPRLHLNMIGVRSSSRGQGISRILLDEVHRRAQDHPTAEGVSLTTENPANLPFYERFGYRITGEARVADGLVTWAMFRRDLL